MRNGKQDTPPSKQELESQVDETRRSITRTVSEIKDTVDQRVETVKKALGGVAQWRDQFKEEPVVWSLGALAAGFAMGYTVGHAQSHGRGRKKSEIAEFADALVGEISIVGEDLIMPRLKSNLQRLFGVDLAKVLKDLHASSGKTGRRSRLRPRRGKARNSITSPRVQATRRAQGSKRTAARRKP